MTWKNQSFNIRICEICKKEFKPKSANGKYCSEKCKNNATRYNLVCKNCKKEFLDFNKRKFCSRKCFHQYQKTGVYKGTFNSRKKDINEKKYVKLICDNPICKKEYYKKESAYINCKKKNWNQFCCTSCKNEYKYNINHIFIKCDICNKWVEKRLSYIKNNKKYYCSLKCSRKNLLTTNSFYNNLEKYFASILNEQNINFKKQQRISDFVVDFKSNKIILEVYGDYWHCNPEQYSKEYFHKHKNLTAEEIWQFDNMRKKMIESKGYKVYIFWESDINCNKEKIVKDIETIFSE